MTFFPVSPTATQSHRGEDRTDGAKWFEFLLILKFEFWIYLEFRDWDLGFE